MKRRTWIILTCLFCLCVMVGVFLYTSKTSYYGAREVTLAKMGYVVNLCLRLDYNQIKYNNLDEVIAKSKENGFTEVAPPEYYKFDAWGNQMIFVELQNIVEKKKTLYIISVGHNSSKGNEPPICMPITLYAHHRTSNELAFPGFHWQSRQLYPVGQAPSLFVCSNNHLVDSVILAAKSPNALRR